MVKKPEHFANGTIWKEKINAEAFESWVQYVREIGVHKLKKSEFSVSSKADIHVKICVSFV